MNLQKQLSQCEESFGRASPQVAEILDKMAVVLKLQGKDSAAAEKYRQLLSVQEAVHGPHHPNVGDACWCIAANERALGKLAEAKDLYARAEACYSRNLGPAHTKTQAAHAEVKACVKGMVKRAVVASTVTVRSVLGSQRALASLGAAPTAAAPGGTGAGGSP